MRRLLVLLLLLVAANGALAASFPPGLRFHSLQGERATVHYHDPLEPQARQALALADAILARHGERYGYRPRRVHVVLADVTDSPNGFATPFPYPLVRIEAIAPDGTDDLGNHEGWLKLVLTHELAHVVHLDQARGLPGAGRKLFGRAPFLFPNSLTPGFLLEGLATYEETEGTAFGRGRDADVRMVLRMAALEGRTPTEDRAVLALDAWPGGTAQYLFGEAFLRDLSRRHGEETLPEIARRHSGRLVPFLDDVTAKRVTGRSFHASWRAWSAGSARDFAAEAERIERRGATPSRALTSRGIRQIGPRFSPDGTWIAYTSGALTRLREVRLVRPDGTGDRRLCLRNGGAGLAWAPDGQSLVFDEPEVAGTFATRSDLRAVEVASGRVRKLTRGLRAREPDIRRDGARLVFVRQYPDRAELALADLDGSDVRDLTRSEAGAQWSGPRFAPDGARIVASRWSAGGHLDLVLVDAASGAVEELTRDRAKDVEPDFSPDGAFVVFRSDRDGVSNLYALRLADRALLRVTDVVGGAFSPDVAPDARSVAFSSYSSRGYDVHLADLDVAGLEFADPFADPYPPPTPTPAASTVDVRPYRPFPAALPRFWTPFAASTQNEWRIGAAAAGIDPLFRHTYGFELHRGTETGKLGGQGFWQYDRFRPTFLLTAEDTWGVEELREGDVDLHSRELVASVSFPFARSLRRSQSVALAYRRLHEREDGPPGGRLDFGGVQASWTLDSRRSFPFLTSPVDGVRVKVSFEKEAPGLGSQVALSKLTGDLRTYLRAGGRRVLALSATGGATFGAPRFEASYRVGGYPDGSLFDVVLTNHGVLRGYPDGAFRGRSFAAGNAELRFPLASPQRGWRTLPVFVRHLHGGLFVDAANVWTDRFRAEDVRTGVGGSLGADLVIGHGLPLTGVVTLGRGLSDRGETRLDLRLGLAF